MERERRAEIERWQQEVLMFPQDVKDAIVAAALPWRYLDGRQKGRPDPALEIALVKAIDALGLVVSPAPAAQP